MSQKNSQGSAGSNVLRYTRNMTSDASDAFESRAERQDFRNLEYQTPIRKVVTAAKELSQPETGDSLSLPFFLQPTPYVAPVGAVDPQP